MRFGFNFVGLQIWKTSCQSRHTHGIIRLDIRLVCQMIMAWSSKDESVVSSDMLYCFRYFFSTSNTIMSLYPDILWTPTMRFEITYVRNITFVMGSKGISRKLSKWHFQLSISLESSLGEVHLVENPIWIGSVVPKLKDSQNNWK